MDLESGRTVGGLWVDGEGSRAVIDASGAETRLGQCLRKRRKQSAERRAQRAASSEQRDSPAADVDRRGQLAPKEASILKPVGLKHASSAAPFWPEYCSAVARTHTRTRTLALPAAALD
jgi:hypothetical protein